MNYHNDSNFPPRHGYHKPALYVYGSINRLTKENVVAGLNADNVAQTGKTNTGD